jgi:DNA-binding MarR family transcriptional regulator
MAEGSNGSEASAGNAVQAALARVLRWSGRRANRRILYGAQAEDLSQNEVWLLDAVEGNGPVRLSDLASWQGVDKSTITPQIRRLEQRGLIQRQASTGDRRAVEVGLTVAGRSLQQHRAAAGAALIDEVMQDWPEQDRRRFADLFVRFADRLQAHPTAGLDSRADVAAPRRRRAFRTGTS